MTTVEIKLPARNYRVQIGDGSLELAGAFLRGRFGAGRVAVVSDTNVLELHGARLRDSLNGLDFFVVEVEPGERSKSLPVLERVLTEFVKRGLKRSEPVVAFGGGVVGDLAGFAAATYMRGVPFVQVPTTLLAQVDSSVGGKVAVNLCEGKNLVGNFYQPTAVFADTSLLDTLPEREWMVGLAEAVKHAAIGETQLVSLLSDCAGARTGMEQIVALNCAFKARFVEHDEHDNGERMLLNFGHTFGHALEKLYNYEKYNHGEAVAIGMALAARAGAAMGVTPPATVRELLALMDAAGLKYNFDDDIFSVIPLMASDKKNESDGVTMILLERFGAPVVRKTSVGELATLFKEGA